MRSLWRRMIPFVWIMVVIGSFWFDIQSPPARQLSASMYLFMVEQYQQYGRPLLHGYIVCRFQPSCSVYSIMAVKRHGFINGLFLTFDRLLRCRDSVPRGTRDPVPES